MKTILDTSPRGWLLLETNRTMARKYTISPDSESVIETKGEGIAGDAPRTVVEVRATINDWTIGFDDRRRQGGGDYYSSIDHLDDPIQFYVPSMTLFALSSRWMATRDIDD